jgi:hypothetical protein
MPHGKNEKPTELPASRLNCGAGTDEAAVLSLGTVWIGETGSVTAAG